MSLLNKEIYQAFIEVGVTKESASLAAESVEHSGLDKCLAIVETKLDAISKMMWIVIAGILALVLKAYFIVG
ncbi:MAG: hypothetical protein HFP81_03020 [Methylococcales symbiont of Hymedesmia sp. n. MRB-2018]|nr:MAG: hypothetical protein HFP78_03255 [Methylococcales symbiont of Hymedesmia sp. n. MRB-2018]KAF3984245.1 MAG: hypothetical protein HFP81_03020 [Methylococcales symbiont of Hymedesmia sp. n. MRB-2018]